MNYTTKSLKNLIKQLRNPNTGCDWDVEQTQKSLTKFIIEEAYEVVAAIEDEKNEEIIDELGDLLLQIIFQTQIAEEKNLFSYENVVKNICEKIIRRHPHIFGEKKFKKNSNQQKIDWEKIKNLERRTKKNNSIMNGISDNLPPIQKAKKIQDRASLNGFDWDNILDIFNKIEEEIKELKIECNMNNEPKIEEEYGDLLFTIINLSKYLDLDPEIALRKANNKFLYRFNNIEKKLKMKNIKINDLDKKSLNIEWEKVKNESKNL